ncbi:MAG: metalloregulator ArsR/SmtB family transcription factor [Rhodobacteraceae bacterium]|nr:metalloregulator ArsR/SmtB family transcription factor [Paracoccaceae bacterium]
MSPLLKAFSALSDETRLSIVEQLMKRGELPAGDLVEGSGISAPAISRHLKVLRDAGLVRQRAEGTKRLYSPCPDGLQLIANWTISRREFWDTSLDRLEAAILEEDTPS